MASEDIPPEIKLFIFERITSVEQISILELFLKNPNREWSIAEITQELRSGEASIQTRLNDLCSTGVLLRGKDEGGRHPYSPESENVAILIRKLVETYRKYPNRVIELIYSKSSQSLHAFSDAFKLKKDKP